jgi:hypothetical protein
MMATVIISSINVKPAAERILFVDMAINEYQLGLTRGKSWRHERVKVPPALHWINGLAVTQAGIAQHTPLLAAA